jgi:hypothetical protein
MFRGFEDPQRLSYFSSAQFCSYGQQLNLMLRIVMASEFVQGMFLGGMILPKNDVVCLVDCTKEWLWIFVLQKNPKFVYGVMMKGGGASRVDHHQELSVGFCVVSS